MYNTTLLLFFLTLLILLLLLLFRTFYLFLLLLLTRTIYLLLLLLLSRTFYLPSLLPCSLLEEMWTCPRHLLLCPRTWYSWSRCLSPRARSSPMIPSSSPVSPHPQRLASGTVLDSCLPLHPLPLPHLLPLLLPLLLPHPHPRHHAPCLSLSLLMHNLLGPALPRPLPRLPASWTMTTFPPSRLFHPACWLLEDKGE